MNVLSNKLVGYHDQQLKNCREIRFSNGGHMFAAAHGPGSINIYNFYTQECPANMSCKGHNQKVRSIEWYENDMGFTSCGMDGNVFFYDLQKQKEEMTRNSEKDFTQKGVTFTGLTNIPGCEHNALVVGNDRHIWRTADSSDKTSCDAKAILTQVAYLASGKAFFAGTGEENRPGCIQIWKSTLEKICEIQAHGRSVERMRISFDNNYLFTAGRDGTLIIYDIKDRDPRGGVIKRDFGGVL
jgi:WD40 repeat protein